MDIEIADIAHGLAFVARWNGQTRGDWPYSVAEHSLLVERLFAGANPGIAARWRLAALLHDAPEYVIGDMISPVKATVGPSYNELDRRLTAAVHLRFGLPAVLPLAVKKAIKAADNLSAWAEAVQIAGFSEAEADRFFGRPDALTLRSLTGRQDDKGRIPQGVLPFLSRGGLAQAILSDNELAASCTGDLTGRSF